MRRAPNTYSDYHRGVNAHFCVLLLLAIASTCFTITSAGSDESIDNDKHGPNNPAGGSNNNNNNNNNGGGDKNNKQHFRPPQHIFYQDIGNIFETLNPTTTIIPQGNDDVEQYFMRDLSTLILVSRTRISFYDIRQFREVHRVDLVPPLTIELNSLHYFFTMSVKLCHIVFQSSTDGSFQYFSLRTEHITNSSEEHDRIAETLSQPTRDTQIHKIQGFREQQKNQSYKLSSKSGGDDASADAAADSIIFLAESVFKVFSPGLRVLAFDALSFSPIYNCLICDFELTAVSAKCTQFPIDDKYSPSAVQEAGQKNHNSRLYEYSFSQLPIQLAKLSSMRSALVCNTTTVLTFSIDYTEVVLINIKIPNEFTTTLGAAESCEFKGFHPILEKWSMLSLLCQEQLTLIHMKDTSIIFQVPFNHTTTTNTATPPQNSKSDDDFEDPDDIIEDDPIPVIYQFMPISMRYIQFQETMREYRIKPETLSPFFFETGSIEDRRILPFLLTKFDHKVLLHSELCGGRGGGGGGPNLIAYFAEEMACSPFGCELANMWNKEVNSTVVQLRSGENGNSHKKSGLEQMICLRKYSHPPPQMQEQTSNVAESSWNLISYAIQAFIWLLCTVSFLFIVSRCCPNSIQALLKPRLEQATSSVSQAMTNVSELAQSQPPVQPTVTSIQEQQFGEPIVSIPFVEQQGVVSVPASASASAEKNILNNDDIISQQSEMLGVVGVEIEMQQDSKLKQPPPSLMAIDSISSSYGETPTAIPPSGDDVIENYYKNPLPYVYNQMGSEEIQQDKLLRMRHDNLSDSASLFNNSIKLGPLASNASDMFQSRQNLDQSQSLDTFMQMMQENFDDSGSDKQQQLKQFVLSESALKREHSMEGCVGADELEQLQHPVRALSSSIQQFEMALSEQFGNVASDSSNKISLQGANYFQLAASMLKKAIFAQAAVAGSSQESNHKNSQRIAFDEKKKQENPSKKQRSRDNIENESQHPFKQVFTGKTENNAAELESKEDQLLQQSQQNPLQSYQSLCTICYEYPDDYTLYKCGHRYCKDCATSAFTGKKICPYCSQEILDIIRWYNLNQQ